MVKIFSSFLMLFILLTNLYTQEIEYEVEHFDRDKINLEITPYRFYQDSKGFLWILYKSGLYKFDGYNFKQFYIDFNNRRIGVPSPFEDSYNNLWIVTMKGLVKFDLEKEVYINYKNDSTKATSLSSNDVRSIQEDKFNNLWIGTKEGLDKYDRESDSFIHYNIEPVYKNKNPGIWTIYKDNYDIMWITTNNAIYNYDGNQFKSIRELSQNYNFYIMFHEDKANVLWCTGLNKISKFDRITEKFVDYKINVSNNNRYSKLLGFIVNDGNDNIWAGNYTGNIFKYDKDLYKFFKYKITYQDLNSIFKINKNMSKEIQRIVFTFFYKYNQFNKNMDLPEFKTIDLIQSIINKDNLASKSEYLALMNIDRSKNLWLGGDNGLYKVDIKAKFYNYYKCPIYKSLTNSNQVSKIFIDKLGFTWIGTKGGGLLKYHLDLKKYERFTHNPGNKYSICSNIIWDVFEDEEGDLWVVTKVGLSKYDRISNHFLPYHCDPDNHFDNRITALNEDSKGNIWIGFFQSGIFKINKDSIIYKNYNLFENENYWNRKNAYVQTIYEDKLGILWIGTNRGLYKFDQDKDIYSKIEIDKKQPYIINSITEDKFGSLWIGTSDGLYKLCIIDGKIEKNTYFCFEDGLASNHVISIVASNKNLWIATENGLSILNVESNKFRNLKDNLNKIGFTVNSACKNDSGDIFFGTKEGFLHINANVLNNLNYIPTIVFTDFKVFNKSLSIDHEISPSKIDNSKNSLILDEGKYLLNSSITYSKELKFSYKENYFSIEFASLDYTKPENNHYAYKMEGFDKDWIYCGNKREASYTNLDPGEYIFKVKGTNYLGVWNEQGTSIKVIILPPWWATWWFRILIVILFLGILYWIFRYRTSVLRRKHQAQKEFSQKLIESQEKERKRIATALHDSHGQNLLIISNEMQKYVDKNKQAKIELKNVTNTVQDSINEIREISYDLHPHILERVGLGDAIDSMIVKISKSSDIQFDLILDKIDKLFDKKVEINIYRIIQEAVNNIIKHSQATEVKLEIKKNIKYVNIKISDNGIGFDKRLMKKENNGLGFEGMKERVNLINGKYKLKSEQGRGTTVEIKIPFKA